MKLIVIKQSTHARLKAAAINQQFDSSGSTLLPDGKIGISVEDEVYQALTNRMDEITSTFDDVIISLFCTDQ